MKIIKFLFGFLLLSAVIITGCTSKEDKAMNSKHENIVPEVKTVQVKKQVSKYSLNLPGELEPYEEVEIFPKISGFIKKLYVDRGHEVKKGQLLARLEAPEVTQQYLAASAKQREVAESMRYSLQAYNRLKEAAKTTGAVAPIELEQAHAALLGDSATYESLKAEMSAAEQMTEYLEIRAPFDGIITTRNMSQGALVGANEKPLFTLAQQERLRLSIAIPEKHARSLQDSTIIHYQISNYPNQNFTAKLSRSSRVLDKSLRSLIVEFDISNKDGKLNGGEYVQAKVNFQRSEPSLWVPSSSIVQTSSGSFVLKVENNTVKRIPVKEGIKKDTLTEVFGNLKEQDQVVLKGKEGIAVSTL